MMSIEQIMGELAEVAKAWAVEREKLGALLHLVAANASAEGATERERVQWGAVEDILEDVLGV